MRATEVFRELGFERASMSEIAARVGGSKATLYGYFESKEHLFLAVTDAEATAYFAPLMDEVSNTDQDLATALWRFGEKAMAYMLRPTSIAGRRMVLAVSGQSQIGRAFYMQGPRKGVTHVASYFDRLIKTEVLKRGDPWVMAQQFIALLEAELIPERLYGFETDLPSESIIHAAVGRAIDVFITAYGRPP